MQILCSGALTLHCVARDGVCVTYNNSNGNAITGASVTNGRCITLSRDCFAKAYKSDNCVEYADKASAYSGGGVGSCTKGVYVDSATGKPKAMTYCLGKDVPSGMQIICSISDPLKLDSRTGALSINIANSNNALETDDEKPITAKAMLTLMERILYKLTKK